MKKKKPKMINVYMIDNLRVTKIKFLEHKIQVLESKLKQISGITSSALMGARK